MSVTESTSQSQDAERERQISLVRQAELIISHVLRGGVLLSAAVVLVGVVLYYATPQPGGAAATLTYPHSLGAVIPALYLWITRGNHHVRPAHPAGHPCYPRRCLDHRLRAGT